MFTVRRLRLGEGELYRQIRLTSLQESPFAFTTTYESALKRAPESWDEQADRSAEGSDRATFLLFSDEDPIGIAALYKDEKLVDKGELIQVWVAPDFRGTGVVDMLMNAVITWAKENNYHQVFAGVASGNDRALRFYQKWGFRLVEETWEDASGSYLVKDV
jgi:RimJ/RimL family protein N-acetyltransferase